MKLRVLIKELQSLGLDVRVLDADENEIDLKQNFEEEDDGIPQPVSSADDEDDLESDLGQGGFEHGDLDDGFSDEDIARVHAPVGVDIAAETPEEIAISIAAQIIRVRRGWQG